MRPVVFVADADAGQAARITAQLERSRRFRTEPFTESAALLTRLDVEPPDAVVCDLHMADPDGVGVTRHIRAAHETLPVLITTPSGTEEDAERAFAAGATDVLAKPLEPGLLITRIARLLEDVPARELASSVARTRFDPGAIIGDHPRIEAVRTFIRQVAPVPRTPVLLLGESGTGKNMVARAVHGAGREADRRFVEINCATLAANVMETELFGHDPGYGTRTRKGLVEAADGGTLFLDEVASISLDVQAKLLSFLESRAFRRIGSTEVRFVDLRVVAATNTNLERAVAEGRFRDDLYYRLNVAAHTLPPLRAVRSDIPRLVRFFVERAAHYFARPVPEIDVSSLSRLRRHDWPGNFRELRNVVERAMIFSGEGRLRIEVDPGTGAAGDGAGVRIPLGLTLAEVERRYLDATLKDDDGTINEMAKRLGVSRKVFWQRRRQYGLG